MNVTPFSSPSELSARVLEALKYHAHICNLNIAKLHTLQFDTTVCAHEYEAPVNKLCACWEHVACGVRALRKQCTRVPHLYCASDVQSLGLLLAFVFCYIIP